jgi:hypothetical protein
MKTLVPILLFFAMSYCWIQMVVSSSLSYMLISMALPLVLLLIPKDDSESIEKVDVKTFINNEMSRLSYDEKKGGYSVSPKKEIVYILSNSSMPGLIKIGRTNRSVEDRLKELNNTSLPTEFFVEHTIETSDSKFLEKMIHKNFDKQRVNDNREFFKIHHEIVIDYANSINKLLN